ncbi:MAG: hypothetical protein AB7K09_11210, partial [Planctomycetota bacterium]
RPDDVYRAIWLAIDQPAPGRAYDPARPSRVAVPDRDCQPLVVMDEFAALSWPLQMRALSAMVDMLRPLWHEATRALGDNFATISGQLFDRLAVFVRRNGAYAALHEAQQACHAALDDAYTRTDAMSHELASRLRLAVTTLAHLPQRMVMLLLELLHMVVARQGLADRNGSWLWSVPPDVLGPSRGTLRAVLAEWRSTLPFARTTHAICDTPDALPVLEAMSPLGPLELSETRLANVAARQHGLRRVIPLVRQRSPNWHDELTVIRDAGMAGDEDALDMLRDLLVPGDIGRLHGVHWAMRELDGDDAALAMLREQLAAATASTGNDDRSSDGDARQWLLTLVQLTVHHGAHAEDALASLDVLAQHADRAVASSAANAAAQIREAPISECMYCREPLRLHANIYNRRYMPGRMLGCAACKRQSAWLPQHNGGPGAMRLTITWEGHTPNARELQAVRQLLPGLRDFNLVGLRSMLSVHTLSLGRFPAAVAERLNERATQLGLDVALSRPTGATATR